MIYRKQFSLIKIIYTDLYIYGKVKLVLLLFIIISSILVILITHQTRCILIDRERLLLEKHTLDTEWNNLILRKTQLSNHVRIEHIAINKLQMRYRDPMLDNKIYE
ncbi:putative cell division protein [Candidatus Blochmanniella vafra str. BVAF]|uniref:Cell division protein FtsL n=1 Tax=Blochmanniella vafra (strain BVAF) TaxID=859654 RepID=E8Q5P6_BLOVB|nr:cell division protein FtsL [Candidatus Blochmannia vafer]ADV33543.1 putative cell division protein [Candidatus Blochmannia vafer str. BVAF]